FGMCSEKCSGVGGPIDPCTKALCAQVPARASEKRSSRSRSPRPPVIHNDSSNPSPIPGAGRPVRGLFVSRNGGLMLSAPGRARRGAPADDACSAAARRPPFRAGQRGWTLYLIGNEEDVAKGRVSDAAWEPFEAGLQAKLSGEGIRLVRHY